MIPRNLFRYGILISFLIFVTLASAILLRTDALATHLIQGSTMTAHCSSEMGGNVVYISKFFDVFVSRVGGGISTSPLNFAFKNYLVEEYDFKSNANYSAGCRIFPTLSQAEADRGRIISQAQQANKQIVELKWNPGPIVAVDHGDSFSIGPKVPAPSHTFCAVGHDDTMYFSAVFDTTDPHGYQAVGNAFNDFLRKRYGFEAQVDATCTALNTMREAEFVLKARIGGVRQNNHKFVETGWKYGAPLPLAVGTGSPMPKRPPKVVDDVEPPPVPVRPPPPPSINDFATKEGPQVLTYCQKDAMLHKVFDCYRVQRSVYNYRMEHGTVDSLVSLFKEEKVNLAEAIGTGLGQWVRDRATAQGLDNRVTNCIEQKFNVSFYEKPYISKMLEIYNASVAACKP
jgi:hypothetical protein